MTSGVENPPAEDIIENDTVIYDLMGRPINPANIGHGIYLVNGKKVVL